MPVHSAGPRLYHGLKFRHLVKHGGGSRSSNVSLNLVPFVDMMTILVSFLLMVFSADGELAPVKPGLDLPTAYSKAKLQKAPFIQVGKGDVTLVYQGEATLIGNPADIVADTAMQIPKLAERLEVTAKSIKERIALKPIQACEDAKNNIKPKEGEACPDGLAVLQADATTDVRVINKIVATARTAGFYNLLFAVKSK